MPAASLVIREGPRAGQHFQLDGELIIGRDATADLILDDLGISRRHLSIRAEAGAIIATDLGSSNGTFVNGRRITGPVELADGDEIRLGDTLLTATTRPTPGRSPVPARLGPPPHVEDNIPALAAAFCGPLSIFLLVFSSGAAFFVCLPIAITAVVLGTMGLRREGRRTLARIGRITGIAGTILSLLALIAFLVVIAAFDATEDSLDGIIDRIRDEIAVTD